ncbi:hypothetical protein KAJ27_07640, partial [bacterium]|nr:hypothetical protein [bacterium]
MDKIITLQIGITDFCNFRCKMCVQSDVNDFRVNKKGFMAFSTWKGIMDRMQAYGKRFSILLIWIGESFL